MLVDIQREAERRRHRQWYKAQLVAKGYGQTHRVDYEETFAPVAKMTTIRTVIVLATAKGWHLHQMDIPRTPFSKVN